MKKILKIFALIIFLICIGGFFVNAEEKSSTPGVAEEVYTEESYTVIYSEESYRLYKASHNKDEPVLSCDRIEEIMEYISNDSDIRKIHFADIRASERISFEDGEYLVSGKISFLGEGGMLVDGAELSLDMAEISLADGCIRVKKGRVTVTESRITSRETAVVMNYSAAAELRFESGLIQASSESGALEVLSGIAYILGGRIENGNGAAIISSSSLVMSGAPAVLGLDYDVIATAPIELSYKGEYFEGRLRLKTTAEYEKGRLSVIAYGAKGETEESIELYDKLGKRIETKYYERFPGVDEKSFISAYIPFEIKYKVGEEVFCEYKMCGEAFEEPSLSIKDGYSLVGWREGDINGDFYEFSNSVSSDLLLYPEYKLCAPTFSFFSFSFTYDTEARCVRLTELSHPLLSDGTISYRWFKDGKELSIIGDKIEVKNVNESGKYKCIFTFYYGSDSVTVETPEINVEVFKREVAVPTVPSVTYNGEYRLPTIYSNSFYEVTAITAADTGIYPVKISLWDKENYCFFGTDATEVTVFFEILKAENRWTVMPSVSDIYRHEELKLYGSALFGECVFLFSESENGEYTEQLPKKAGIYYVIARVEGAKNYTELTSPPIPFSVKEDTVEALYIRSLAEKREYAAFECFEISGAIIVGKFISGRECEIPLEDITVEYSSGGFFLYGDSSVSLKYEDKFVLHPVSVRKAEYDISAIRFSDTVTEYSGIYQKGDFLGELPRGKDGIPLQASVEGGGRLVGSYAITLNFCTESRNYNIPESITATLTVAPKIVDVIWSDTEFVYDGNVKLPVAHYFDVNGKMTELYVSGARSYAGTYRASATVSDSNYSLNNSECEFKILKASYDLSGVVWSSEGLFYCGEPQSIFLSGLPSGISVVGYSDNTATNAGKYIASATLSYDEANYNPPGIITHEWEILPAEYDMSGISFLNKSYVYDGEIHFPEIIGDMPIGYDGSRLSFSFSKGAVNVEDGDVLVEITFFTDSKNYVAPPTLARRVNITPKPISVLWESHIFVYSDTLHSPIASSDECEIAVIGAARNAGKYTAYAKALSSNYSVTNGSFDYEILKADNEWQTLPKIEGIFESQSLSPIGASKFGITQYIFSEDGASVMASAPSSWGKYYFKAFSDGDNNHNGISSEWIEFEITEVIPVAFFAVLLKNEFFTLSYLCDEDFEAYVENNDGSISPLYSSDIKIIYRNGKCFSATDEYVQLSYLGFSVESRVKVKKRNYDLSDVKWDKTEFVYSGKNNYVYLSGLPDGLKVKEYVGNGRINAGQYSVRAILEYDSENYNEPIILDAVMTVKKQTVPIPKISSVEYSSELEFPEIEENDLYKYSFSGAEEAGKYEIVFSLTDSENYSFENGLSEASAIFEIERRRLTVKVSDISTYIFNKNSSPGFTVVSGSLADGDTLSARYIISDGKISAEFDAQNYEIEVVSGTVHRYNRLSPEDGRRAWLILFIIIILVFLIAMLVMNGNRLKACYASIFLKGENFIPEMPIICEEKEDKESSEEIDEKEDKGDDDFDSEPTVIDVNYADSRITDSLAKDLIRKDMDIITEGRKRSIINVDTLSRSFSENSRVDINLLKEKNLIPYDTAYIKVLARGIIDKPLDVYANDFSLSAVKMIALSGGKAIKVNTVTKNKSKHNNDFSKKP